MKINILIIAAAVLLVYVLQTSAQYINPLKGDIGIHDPVMIKQGSTYYVFGTGNRIAMKSSTDRINWKNRGSAFSSGAESWSKALVPGNNGSDMWAPDISFRNNKYWLYYSISSFGSNVSAIGVATNPTLDPSASNYKWTDLGLVIKSISSNNYNCIDPNVFEDTDGTLWLAFGSFWSGIKLVQLDPSTGKPLSSNPTITSLATYTGTAIEAAFITKWENYYYLFVSWDQCCKGVNSTYKIAVGRATKVTGPYVDKNNKAMTLNGGVLLWAGDSRWKGPGHQGIFIEHDTMFVVNHAYDANDNGISKLIIRPLYWTTDGWPTYTPQVSETSLSIQKKACFKSAGPYIVLQTNEKIDAVSAVNNIFSIKGEKLNPESMGKKRTRVVIVKPD